MPLCIRATLAPGALTAEASAERGAARVVASASVPGPSQAAKDPSRTEVALRGAFESWGRGD